MANNISKASDLPACSAPVSTDKLIISGNSHANSFGLTLLTLFGNNVTNVVITTITPANTSANGKIGTIAFDSSYFYVCVANNTWRRTALSTF